MSFNDKRINPVHDFIFLISLFFGRRSNAVDNNHKHDIFITIEIVYFLHVQFICKPTIYQRKQIIIVK